MFIQVREALLWFSGSQLCYRLKSPEALFEKSTPDQLNQHFWGQNPGISIFSVMSDSSTQLKLRNYGQLQPKSYFSPFPLSLLLPPSSFPFSFSFPLSALLLQPDTIFLSKFICLFFPQLMFRF